ncbi:phosphoenolpyruvate--protein phosphotransferase [Candidatus Izimaplasma bacterium]|nr:phosphoenolpyruvate--protein phosphotransferase [Candidatus Izimaplasma bacterium]
MIIKGITASEGVIVGTVKIFTPNEMIISENMITDVQKELSLFDISLKKTQKELEELSIKIKSRINEEMIVFDAHIDIAKDPQVINEVTSLINSHQNVAFAYNKVCNKYIDILKESETEYLRERASDIRDVCNRVIKNYFGISSTNLGKLTNDAIIVTKSLNTSELAMLDLDRVKGIITELGGKTSHTSIISRSLGIPYVLGVKNITNLVSDDEIIIINTNESVIIVNPTEEEIVINKKINEKENQKNEQLYKYKDYPDKSKDGKQYMISSNINNLIDIDHSIKYNVKSIGLYRTEYLFIGKTTLPTEEEQYNHYSVIFKRNHFKKVVFRTLDISNDKNLSKLSDKEKVNINMSGRGLCFTLNNKAILKQQLRALLRISVMNVIHIMYPVVDSVDDLTTVKELVQECKNELVNEGVVDDFKIFQGVMIETQKAVDNIDDLAQSSDFISIGTNDLLQDIYKTDRDNQRNDQLNDLYNPYFIKTLKKIIESAHKHHKPISLCGEMASDIYSLPILMGLGLDEFSMNPSNILNIRRILSQIHSNDISRVIKFVLESRNSGEVKEYISAYFRREGIIKN